MPPTISAIATGIGPNSAALIGRWKSSVKHQVTWSGLVFTAIILMVGLGAFASGNNLLFLLLAVLAGGRTIAVLAD